MAAYLYDNQMRFEDPISIRMSAKRILYTFGFQRKSALKRLLLNFDLAFSHDVLADSFTLLEHQPGLALKFKEG